MGLALVCLLCLSHVCWCLSVFFFRRVATKSQKKLCSWGKTNGGNPMCCAQEKRSKRTHNTTKDSSFLYTHTHTHIYMFEHNRQLPFVIGMKLLYNDFSYCRFVVNTRMVSRMRFYSNTLEAFCCFAITLSYSSFHS